MQDTPPQPEPAPAPQSRLARLLPWLVAGVLIVVWAFELNALQARTLVSESGWKHVDYHVATTFRMLLNLLFCGSLVLLLPRWAQAVGFVVLLLFAQAAGFYHHYFGRGLSWTTLTTQFTEGAESVVLDKAFILPGLLAVSLLLLVVKLALVWVQGRYPLRWRRRLPLGAALVVAYFASIFIFNSTSNTRLTSLRTWMSFDRVGVAQGYLVTWAGEVAYLSNADRLESALEASKQRDDRITPIEGPLELPGHVVLLQVESLDWHVLGLEHDGVEITPNLNALRDTSMLFQVTAVHRNGSADADFVMLHRSMVAPGVINYKIPGYPHGDTLPAAARAAGRPMTMLHGNKGRFFNRRDAFDQMDFAELIFLEEMVDTYGQEPKKWGAVPDRELLLLSARLLNGADTPQSQLVITYTSHTPFVMLPDDADRPFANPDDAVHLRYFNSIHYVDDAIGEYLDALPDGTTVVIYADHEGAAGYDARHRAHGEPELIPVMVWRKGEDLSTRQRSAAMPEARSAEWSIIDIAGWVRASFDHAAEVTPTPAPAPAPNESRP